MKILFTGDISLNDDYILAAEAGENPFNSIQNYFKRADLVIGNLEAVCESKGEVNILKTPRLKTSLIALEYLKTLNIGLVTLANNHLYDNLEGGLKKTIKFLNANNIEYVGADIEENKQYKILTLGDRKIAFLNYVHPLTNPKIPLEAQIHINTYDKSVIIKDLRQVRNTVDYVVLLLHWGIDNSYYPAPWQRSEAKLFAQSGADLIIGHHSHTKQGSERFGKSNVFYGLGNFAFSGFISKGKRYDLNDCRQRESYLVELAIKKEKIETKVIPMYINGIKVIKTQRKNLLYFQNILLPLISNRLIWPFYSIYLNYVYRVYFYLFGNRRNPFKQIRKLNSSLIKKYFHA